MTVRGRRTIRGLLIAALLFVIAAVAYAPAINGPFLFDDFASIPDNVTIQRLWPPSIPLHPPPRQITVSGRPVVNYTLAVNYAINEALGIDQRPDPDGPRKTTSYHVVNLLLHLACGALLFGLIRRTLRGRAGDAPWIADADSLAAGIATIWLLHPIQSEAVNYLIQRTEIIVSLCYLGTLYAAIRAWDAGSGASRVGWYALSTTACLLGMGSKEVMISAPVAVVLYDRAFRATSWRGLLSTRAGRPWLYVALAATSGWLITLMVSGARSDSVGFGHGISWYAYLYSQAWAILHYLRLVAWPTQLSLDYGLRPIDGPAGIPGLVVLTVFLALTIAAWTRPNRWGWFGFLGAWFFMLLAPSSSVVPITTEIAAERRIYLALAAVIVLGVVGIETLHNRLRPAGDAATDAAWAKKRVIAFGVIAAILAVGTFARSETYSSAVSIWRDAIVKRPNNARAYEGLGLALLHETPPREDLADSVFHAAIALDSTSVPSLYQLAVHAGQTGHMAEARAFLERAVAANPNFARALALLGDLLVRSGDAAEAIPYLERVNAYGPTDTTLINLGNAYTAAGRPDDAVRAFRQALVSNPARTDVMGFLGALLTEQGRPEDAVPYLEEAVRRRPGRPVTTALLSLAYAGAKREADAVDAARSAISLGGNDPRVYLFAGEALLRVNQARDAEPALETAARLSPSDPEVLTQLGVAKAMLGERAAAVVLFHRVLAANPGYVAAQDALRRLGGP